MDLSKTVSVVFAGFLFISIPVVVIGVTYSIMDAQGSPTGWEQYSGYKVAASFHLANYNGEFSSMNESKFKNMFIKGGEICSADMPGFYRNGEPFMIADQNTDTCSDPLFPLNISVYSEESNSNYWVQVGS